MDYSSLAGSIDLSTCADVVTRVVNQNLVPLAACTGALFVLLIVLAAYGQLTI